MAITFAKEIIHSGAETVTDQLSGTAVAFAGPTGWVEAAFASSDGTNKALLKGRESGKEVIPNNSNALQRTLADEGDTAGQGFLYRAQVKPGEPLELTVVAATASTDIFVVRTY